MSTTNDRLKVHASQLALLKVLLKDNFATEFGDVVLNFKQHLESKRAKNQRSTSKSYVLSCGLKVKFRANFFTRNIVENSLISLTIDKFNEYKEYEFDTVLRWFETSIIEKTLLND